MTLYELRHYELFPHNREHLHQRFVDHTLPIFDRLGFETAGFFDVVAGAGEGDLVYLMKWASADERTDGWARFGADPEWHAARSQTNGRHGPLVARTNSTLLRPTGYSRL